MRIAVISDTHDHLGNLDSALKQMSRIKPAFLVHCGDLSAPFVIDHLAAFGGTVHVCFGNNEGDRSTIQLFSEKYENIILHGVVGFVETPEGEIAFTHLPEFARGLASTGRYRAVFYGHTHRRKTEKIDDTWLVNPGNLMGHREPPGWITFDLSDGTQEHFTVEGTLGG